MISRVHREQVKALATGDMDRASDLNESLSQSERRSYNQYLSAVFSIFLEEQFKDELSRDAIAAFVANVRQELQSSPQAIKPWAMEGVIRASCGEEFILDEISGEDVLGTQILVVGVIGRTNPNISSQLDRFLDDAEALTEEWAQESD